MKHTDYRLIKAHAGVTLVELLIAMGLSVFLMAAVVQSFLGSRQSADVVQAQVAMQESARFAYMFMARNVRMAGFPTELIEPDGVADVTLTETSWRTAQMPADNSFANFEAESVVWGEDGSSSMLDARSGSDVLHLRLQGQVDGSVSDCQGRAIPDTGNWAQLAFYIDADDNFRCRSDDGDGSVQDAVLVQGIQELQFLYGLNSGVVDSTVPIEEPSQIVSWANAGSIVAGDWRFVVAVKAALVAASNTAPLSTTGPGATYTLLDYTSPSYNDGRARQQFAQTIRLRNQVLNSNPE